MKINENKVFEVKGAVEILREKPNGDWETVLPLCKNKIMDYGRSMFPWMVAGEGYSVGTIVYGDGRPIGNTSSDQWPANGTAESVYPVFVNVTEPDTYLLNIDALEPDIMNMVRMSDNSDVVNPMTSSPEPEYLRFRTGLHNQLSFNTAFGNPQNIITKTYSTSTEVSTGTIPTYTEAVSAQNSASAVDLSALYPEGAFNWAVTFTAYMQKDCRAIVGGTNYQSFVFNEVGLVFSPSDFDEDISSTMKYPMIAMRYLPNITKIEGLAIMIRWSLIF